MKPFVLKLVEAFNVKVVMPVGKWAADDTLDMPLDPNPHGAYVTPVSYINQHVLLAAVDDHRAQLEQDPENCQAVLNACLESVRCDQFLGSSFRMFATLAASGQYEPTEALARVLANVLMTGMLLEKRLQRGEA
jgi:hypothetical protein